MRQGYPLSPYIFIIALEVLNIAIRENKENVAIKVGNKEIKLNVFADDITTFVSIHTFTFRILTYIYTYYTYISILTLIITNN